jgi:polyisoprenoid-binding protein YceI
MRGRALAIALALGLGLLAPAPAPAQVVHYRVQPEASELVFFATSRLMNAEGRFTRFQGTVEADPASPAAGGKVSLRIETASIDTGIGLRDRHLRSDDFFDVERFPAMTFESTRVEGTGRRLLVTGQLTIKGVAREITVPVDLSITPAALMATGELSINRADHGITYDSALNPVGNTVRLSFTVRARPG